LGAQDLELQIKYDTRTDAVSEMEKKAKGKPGQAYYVLAPVNEATAAAVVKREFSVPYALPF
jgi:hypothetical protein